MYGRGYTNPMSGSNKEEKDRYIEGVDYKTKVEYRNGEGTKITYYSDGSSTYHWGGPCGSTNYDANGEEC